MKKPSSKISTSTRDLSSNKLHLARETLRRLGAHELSRVAGGADEATRSCVSCIPPTDRG